MPSSRAAILVCLGLMGSPIYALNFRLPQMLHQKGLIGFVINVYNGLLWQFLPLGALYLVGLGIVFRRDTDRGASPGVLFIILFFGLLYRCLLVPTPPMLSSDMYRYVWDGRVQAHGNNPYRYPPNAPELEGLRDDAVYPYINRKGSPTIYPAGAQLFFYAFNKLGIRSVTSLKGAIVFFEMGSIMLLVWILAELGLNPERVLIYAWHPLVIFELGNNGHLDGVVIFFVLLALYLLIKRRTYLSVASLAAATSLKLYPAVILPAILRERRARGLFIFCLLFTGLYLPYVAVGKQLLGFLPEYFGNPYEMFNLGLKAYLLMLFPKLNHLVVTQLFMGALLLAAGLTWLKRKETIDAIFFAYILAGFQLVLSTAALHPWYILWIIPFMSLLPSPAWLYFSMVVPLSYLKYASPAGGLPAWIRHVEYIPFFLLLAMEYRLLIKSYRDRFPLRMGQKSFGIR